MQSLLLLIRQYRIFLLFIALELTSIGLIVQHNHYQNAVFFNSASYYVANMLSWKQNVLDYFYLSTQNRELAEQNAQLLNQLNQHRQASFPKSSPHLLDDSLIIHKYSFSTARVVNNSTRSKDNYITIDKGKEDGIEPGMGVISTQGIVGRVSASSEHFSTIVSLLHSKNIISAELQKNHQLGRIIWDSKSPRIAKLLEISSHLEVKPGDTVVTSGFNATFPPQIPIGIVKSVKPAKQETFYDIDVELSTKFNQLRFVYVIQNILASEQDSLETETLRGNQ